MAAYLDVGSWQTLGQRQYRKWDVYNMLWISPERMAGITAVVPHRADDMCLDQYIVAVGQFGGPIAMARDPNKIVRLEGLQSTHLCIYNAAGKLIKAIPMRHDTSLVDMGWTASEELVLIYKSGAVDVYNLVGEHLLEIMLLPTITEDVVLVCCIGDSAIAAMTQAPNGNRRLAFVPDLKSPIPTNIDYDYFSIARPECMLIVDGRFTESTLPEVLIATSDMTVLSASLSNGVGRVVDQDIRECLSSPISLMRLSPMGRWIACMCGPMLTVFRSDFEKKLLEFDTSTDLLPSQLLWLAEEAVVMVYRGKGVSLVGPYGDWLKMEYGRVSIHAVQEHDCVRIITDTRHQIVQRVPASTEAIRKIGSGAPGALLSDALEAFDASEAAADENIRTLIAEEKLAQAVRDCMDAASCEWDADQQKTLLKAASYGKSFVQQSDTKIHAEFVTVCKRMRVMNSLRDVSVGMPVTVGQYEKLGHERVVARLVHRHQFRHALFLCDYLGLEKDPVLVHWACAKIVASSDMSDEAVCELIRRNILITSARVSYASIAASADRAGRRGLATRLLDFEASAADQVPLLLSMKEHSTALRKALDSGDTELVFLVILHLKKVLVDEESDEAAFLRLLVSDDRATNLFSTYCKLRDPLMLRKLYSNTHQWLKFGQMIIDEAYRCTNLSARVQTLTNVIDLFKKVEKAGMREISFFVQLVEDQVKLLRLQHQLQIKFPDAHFVDLSVSETLYNLLAKGDEKGALAFQEQFHIPVHRFWHLKIQALANGQKWEALTKFGASKKSPIGYKPFADACIAQSAFEPAAGFIAQMPDVTQRAEYFIKIRRLGEAAELAIKARDRDLCERVYNSTTDPLLRQRIEAAMNR